MQEKGSSSKLQFSEKQLCVKILIWEHNALHIDKFGIFKQKSISSIFQKIASREIFFLKKTSLCCYEINQSVDF